jgi:hypothetical protein
MGQIVRGASFDGASGPGTPVPIRITTSPQTRREGKICYKGKRRILYKRTKVEERIGTIWKKRVGYVKQIRTDPHTHKPNGSFQ